MTREINSVAVLGGGTMGAGIAGAAAQLGCEVLLLDVDMPTAEKALDRIVNGRPPALDDADKAHLIKLGTLSDDLAKIADYDWICEAIVEDLETKRELFRRLEPLRKPGSVISTNTSGIPLKDICEGMPDSLRRNIAVTHFFNPVKVMRLMELIPGADTTPDVIEAFTDFLGGRLGKGVVNAKDTVNFIGNRIGCFWMLSGLHKAREALSQGMDQETIDALMSKPVGLPPTGLFGLIDLIGLDVMYLVGKNLDVNLPSKDEGRAYTSFPPVVQRMYDAGQLGRKTGGGFYRMSKDAEGNRSREVFDLEREAWRGDHAVELSDSHRNGSSLMFDDSVEGRFAWSLMGGALFYAADLVPEISDDVVNIDRAMRWGFAWTEGPFQFLDSLGPARVIARLEQEGRELPKMLRVLKDAGAESFYRNGESEYLGLDGAWHPTPPE
ncbi:MAG: 3-hydroxyacyl-CoA dehydrogenase family protein [Minwuia sp.]|uniref:3-hydroxyacyl-CoA dehydrogenase family protein n=1 Tax=Minwuia sp. TaxID=2493630 RepID=UPI003A83E9D8